MRLILAALLMISPLVALAYARQGQGALTTAGAGPRVDPDAAPPDALPADPAPADELLSPPSFLETIGLMKMKSTRGERNNNPGNIRLSAAPWRGKITGGDAAFETFADATSGIRALALLLRRYFRVYGLDTVRKIIDRYAPASENDTGAYVRAVAAAIGAGPDERLDLDDDGRLSALVAAIITHENGRNIYSAAEIATAVNLA